MLGPVVPKKFVDFRFELYFKLMSNVLHYIVG